MRRLHTKNAGFVLLLAALMVLGWYVSQYYGIFQQVSLNKLFVPDGSQGAN